MSTTRYIHATYTEPTEDKLPGSWIIKKDSMEVTDPEFYIEYKLGAPSHWQYKHVTFLIQFDAINWAVFTKNRGSDATFSFTGGSIKIETFNDDKLKLKVHRSGRQEIKISLLLTIGKDNHYAVTPDPQLVLKPS